MTPEQQRNKVNETSREFPQHRNGVHHELYGVGVVQLAPRSGTCLVKFDDYVEPMWVPSSTLTSVPSRGESPDPKTSRFSGWVGGNNYRKRK